MSPTFTETSHQSWFSRLGNAFKSLIIGLLLFVLSFPVLFWNEGRAVTTARSLNEGQKQTVSVACDTVDRANDGKLVHMSGLASTADVLCDEMFNVEVNAIRIQRIAEMYQWEEDERTETDKTLGGGKKTTKTYQYSKEWSASKIDSGNFRHPEGHKNPRTMLITPRMQTASEVTLGAFQLSDDLVSNIRGSQTIGLDASNIPETFREQMRFVGGELYLGADSESPQIGDIRVRFEATPATEVSILAQQKNASFQPYQTQAGDALSRLEMGMLSAEEMFAHARTENSIFTWVLRALGSAIMLGGLMMLMSPLVIVGDVIPLVGSIVQGSTFLVAALFTLILAPMTIAFAWFFYRPLVAVPLLIVSALAGYFLLRRGKSNSSPEVMTLDESDVVY